MQRADVVTAEIGRDELERSVTEAPGRFDEGEPGRLVAESTLVETALRLKGPDGGLGGRAIGPRFGSDRCESSAAEAPLEVTNGFAVLAGRQ